MRKNSIYCSMASLIQALSMNEIDEMSVNSHEILHHQYCVDGLR